MGMGEKVKNYHWGKSTKDVASDDCKLNQKVKSMNRFMLLSCKKNIF